MELQAAVAGDEIVEDVVLREKEGPVCELVVRRQQPGEQRDYDGETWRVTGARKLVVSGT